MRKKMISKSIVSLVLALLMTLGAVSPVFATSGGGGSVQGETYLTDTDNWDGVVGSSGNDGDLDYSGSRIGNGHEKYPIEFKIEDVDKQPQQSAYLLIKAYDVDEFDGTSGTGEWDRVYFSADPSVIQLGAPYTLWPTDWTDSDYKKEFTKSAYVGALSGNNETWNTTVLKLDPSLITSASSDYYVGVSIHDYVNGGRSTPQPWVVEIDKAQIIIDGGVRDSGEISKGAIEIVGGKMVVDTALLPHIPGDFSMEISLINKMDDGNGNINEQNVDTAIHDFDGVTAETEAPLNDVELGSGLDPNGDYSVNIILFDADGKAQHLINIPYLPVAEPQNVTVEEGDPIPPIVFTGSDYDTVAELVYGIENQPLKGSINPVDSSNPEGNTWIYQPNPDFTGGQDSFTYTVTNATYGRHSLPAKVTITVNKALDGWVGDKEQGDATVNRAIPGQPLKLTAVSSLLAASVTATVNGIPVELTLANAETYTTDGFKKWVKTDYVLPADTASGLYQVDFEAKKADSTPLEEKASRLADNGFSVFGNGLQLSADPEKIVGDGKSTTELTAVLTDEDGNPIKGVEVEFTAPLGTFVGSNKAVTDDQGKAVVTYKSEKISGVNEQQIPVKATVNDPDKGIFAEDQINVFFQPSSIKGVITKGDSNEPVPGATVRVTLDLNGDGKIVAGEDFDETVVTNEKGEYSIPVPKGDAVYDLEVTQTVNIGGVETPVTFNQKAQVGEVTGTSGESYNSEKTVTGIVLFQQPDGKSSLISSALVGKTKVYLKGADGNYISEGGVPKAFELSEQGLFNADGLTAGDYTLEIRYEFEPGKEITISRGTVAVKDDGEMNITQELVDPYGTITDANTNEPIEGAKVVLHYADTKRNKDSGRTPNGEVTLPAIAGFEPNDNASPVQLSDVHGFYAYMVFPDTDYYLVVTKDGYETYTSPTIEVGKDIVKHDLQLTPISSYVFIPPAKPEVSLSISVDNNLVEEGAQSTLTVDYANTSPATMVSGDVTITLPEGVEVIDADGGTVDGNTITWTVKDLAAAGKGSFAVIVKWPQLDKQETSFDVSGEFKVNGNSADTVKADSAVKIQVFSKRFDNLQHQRYILGFPDGLFKPARSLTRAELAAIVARLTDNGESDGALAYSDVPADFWAANYIKIATKNGFFGGFEDGTFRPDAPVKRGELAVVMTRFLKLQVSGSGEAHFTDVKGHWAADAVESLYRSKYVSGYPDGTFKPNNSIVRSEAVTLINRMLNRGPLQGLDPQFPDVPDAFWAFGDIQEATVSHESSRNSDSSETYVKSIEDDVK